MSSTFVHLLASTNSGSGFGVALVKFSRECNAHSLTVSAKHSSLYIYVCTIHTRTHLRIRTKRQNATTIQEIINFDSGFLHVRARTHQAPP